MSANIGSAISMLSGPAILLSLLLLLAGVAVWRQMRSRSPIVLGIVIAIAASPLLVLFVLWDIQTDPLPEARAEGELRLTQEQPIAIVDTEVTLTGGNEAGLAATLYANDRSVRPHRTADSWTTRLDDAGDAAAHAGSVRLGETCTECTYEFRTVFVRYPDADATAFGYEMRFGWDHSEWGVDTDDLPTVAMETRLIDVVSATRSGNTELKTEGVHNVHFTIRVTGSAPQDLGPGIAILTVQADRADISILGERGTQMENDARPIQHARGCEQPQACEISLEAVAAAGDTISWNLEYHYGLSDSATQSTDATVSIADPVVTTRPSP